MNIKKLFTKMSEEDKVKDRLQKQYHNKISAKAKDIALLIVKDKLIVKDVNNLEILYNEYFKKFPDVQGEIRAIQRINKLRSFAK